MVILYGFTLQDAPIYYKSMPKLIDNYVLSRKIGAGQYGEVFKGYDRATNNDIAVKSIRRENVKGTCGWM